jgi:plastocyanin
VSIARNTVYAAVGISGLANGFVVAFRPGGGDSGGVPTPPALPGLPNAPGVGGGSPAVAGPGAQFAGYATPVVTVAHGGSVTFTNLDVPQHDVQGNGFGTPLINTGQNAKVVGVESLAPGSYDFFCSIHRNMKGTLTVT